MPKKRLIEFTETDSPIHAAKFMQEDDMAPSDIGYRLNETPMSALVGPDGRKYGYPKDLFSNLLDQMGNE